MQYAAAIETVSGCKSAAYTWIDVDSGAAAEELVFIPLTGNLALFAPAHRRNLQRRRGINYTIR
jgi:hypothetical protein